MHSYVAMPAARLQACRKAAQCSSLAPASLVAASAMFHTWHEWTATDSHSHHWTAMPHVRMHQFNVR